EILTAFAGAKLVARQHTVQLCSDLFLVRLDGLTPASRVYSGRMSLGHRLTSFVCSWSRFYHTGGNPIVTNTSCAVPTGCGGIGPGTGVPSRLMFFTPFSTPSGFCTVMRKVAPRHWRVT